MKKKSIFKQLLAPMVGIVCALAVALVVAIMIIVASSYEKEIYSQNEDASRLMAGEIKTFLDGAYSVTEELAVNPSILTMNTKTQTTILEGCVSRNSYLELLYIQGTDGMQTARSSGELADRSTRWWFIQTMEEQKAFVSKSYYSVNTGMPCASIFFPMYKSDKMIGVFAVDIKLDYLQGIIEEYSHKENGQISFVIDGEGVVVAHPDSTQIEEQYNYRDLNKTVSSKDAEGNPLTDENGNIITEQQNFTISADLKNVIENVMAGNSGSSKVTYDGATYYASYTTIPLKGESDSWSLITLKKQSAAMSMVTGIIVIAVIVSLLAIIAAVIVMTILAKRLTKPIVAITDLITNASEGDFTVMADESHRNELGSLARSFNKMTSKISGILTSITTLAGEVIQSSDRLHSIEESVGGINVALKEISEGTVAQTQDADRVLMRAEELEGKFQELRDKSNVLLEDADNTMVSSREGFLTVKELARQNEVVDKMMMNSYEKIKTLEEHSRKISDIVNTIDEIAAETELLALNASIEAARAGEHGRGFAVVAESIGKLAADSSKATSDIESIIEELCRDIEDTVSDIEEMKAGMLNQMETVAKVGETFGGFKELAEQTKESVSGIDELVVEMHKLERSMVHAADRIRDISGKAEGLSANVSGSLEEQLADIRNVSSRVNNLTVISAEMEKEMSKFRLTETK